MEACRDDHGLVKGCTETCRNDYELVKGCTETCRNDHGLVKGCPEACRDDHRLVKEYMDTCRDDHGLIKGCHCRKHLRAAAPVVAMLCASWPSGRKGKCVHHLSVQYS